MTTELQIKIYNLVTSGRSYNSVAKELGIGKTTVSTNYLKIRNEKEDRSERSEIISKESISPIITPALTNDTNEFEYKEPDKRPMNVPAKNVPPNLILSGPLVELMELMPPGFKGIIESHSSETATKFGWRLACFLSQYHTPVQIISHDLNKLKLLSVSDPGHDKIILKNCITRDQVMNEIMRTKSGIIILDNFLSLKLLQMDWYQIMYLSPDKAIIVVKKQGNALTSKLNFIAKIGARSLNRVAIETKYGMIEFDMGYSLSNLYTCKNA